MAIHRLVRSLGGGALVAVAALTLVGCTSSGYPADPEGTLDEVSGSTLRVGIVHHPPHVDTSGPAPSGTEVELIEGFADRIDADIEWTVTGEEAVMTAIQDGDLHLGAGGFTTDTPWSTHAAITRSYAEHAAPDGTVTEFVLAAPMGENQFLTTLEAYLDESSPEPP